MSVNKINTLYFFVKDYVTDQENFSQLPMYEKMQFLLDENRNGVIEGWNMEGGNMSALFESVVHDNSEENIRNLFASLGFKDDLDTIFRGMETHLFTNRKLFADQFKIRANQYTAGSMPTLMQRNPRSAELAEAHQKNEMS